MQSVLADVYPWEQGILTTGHVVAQGILNKILLHLWQGCGTYMQP